MHFNTRTTPAPPSTVSDRDGRTAVSRNGGARRARPQPARAAGWALAFSALAVVGSGTAVGQQFEDDKLVPSDGNTDDSFGYSVAISGDTAIVGAYHADDGGEDSGSAYVFVRSDGWEEQAKLLSPDSAPEDLFGRSVSISGDTAIVGAPLADDNGPDSGTAYVFVRSGGEWTEQATLRPFGGGDGDYFGWSVAVCSDTAIIGARGDDDNGVNSGSAYVFVRNGVTWTEQTQLLASDGELGDWLGYSVALSGDTAILGAVVDDDNGNGSGSAYVFRRSDAGWAEEAKLLPSDGAEADAFGRSVSISGDTALIGAPGDDDNGTNSGSAYVFVRDGSVWIEHTKLQTSDGAAHAGFGWSVSISNNLAIGGAVLDDNDSGSGSAHLFVREAGVWAEHEKLTPSDGAFVFGETVSASDHVLLVGAPLAGDTGAAYVFDLCSADLDNDGLVGFGDLLEILAVWGTSGGVQDLDESGLVDFGDVIIVLSVWGPCL